MATGRAPALTRDGRTVYLLRDLEAASAKGVALIEHQLASGAERELIRRESLALLELSPDGRLLATVSSTAYSVPTEKVVEVHRLDALASQR